MLKRILLSVSHPLIRRMYVPFPSESIATARCSSVNGWIQLQRSFCAAPAQSLKVTSSVDEIDVQTNTGATRENIDPTAVRKNTRGKPYNPVNLASSLDYIKSDVYRKTYLDKPIWFHYRRNFSGHFAPPRTRRNCVLSGKLISSNPCPICRDEYLILDFRHTELLKQFLSPISSEILQTDVTGLCQHQHKKLILEVAKAQDIDSSNREPYLFHPILIRGRIIQISLVSHTSTKFSTDKCSFTRLPSNKISPFRSTISVGYGPLRSVAPQTRLRVVDNSAWSSIAPNTTSDLQGKRKTIGLATSRANNQAPSTGVAVQTILTAGTKALAPKPALCIRVYNSQNKGKIGDKVLVAVGGQKKKGWIVGTRQQSKDGWPRFEANNIVLVDDEGNPLGTRILVPIPARLRSLSGDIGKILSIATTFV